MTGHSIEAYLAAHDFFCELDDRNRKFLADSAVVREVSAGDVLFRQRGSADKFYLLRSGEVSVQVPAVMGPALEIQRLKYDQVLGWSWLIPPYRWSFQAMALEDSVLLEFDGSIILARCEQDSEFGYQILKRFAALMSERLDAARQKTMDQWDPPGFA